MSLFKSDFTKNRERSIIASRLSRLLDVSIPICEQRARTEEAHGEPSRLAVPFRDSKTGGWSYDPNFFGGDALKAYRYAVKRIGSNLYSS